MVKCSRGHSVSGPGRCRLCHRQSTSIAYFRRRFEVLEYKARRRAESYGCYSEVVDYAAIYRSSIGGSCILCACSLSASDCLEFHHRVSLADGGPHVSYNVFLVHRFCNRRDSYRLFLLRKVGV